MVVFFLQCFDTVGWVIGSGNMAFKNPVPHIPKGVNGGRKLRRGTV